MEKNGDRKGRVWDDQGGERRETKIYGKVRKSK